MTGTTKAKNKLYNPEALIPRIYAGREKLALERYREAAENAAKAGAAAENAAEACRVIEDKMFAAMSRWRCARDVASMHPLPPGESA